MNDIPIGKTYPPSYSLSYEEQRSNEICAILQQANEHCDILARASAAARARKLPAPTTVEALHSFMLYDAGEWEEEAQDETYDSTDLAEIMDCWRTSALLRKYVHQLRDLGVTPAHINWKLPGEEERLVLTLPNGDTLYSASGE